ncbi:hypothetical protein C7445_1502 [Alicyclobacillus sacchari]|uniref:MinD-like ATPase involved in chromosome partitioning or flagellar assembly n=1 Tax=Alicyclobacillus sacchari TaxID=392010 RepID=A0A4R8L497_9BACL|nr:hypothetical protein [Alicyclobacillus sacchari]TDY37351.1 hypothetical protein C7445_1502 [Alicyclobacillus sacchari]GMA59495.1 hypothetical protein GCM10025858_39990 [Alicyclobacillus sacchari]
MLYLAFPADLRERYAESTWLVYDKQVLETTFAPGDILLLSTWVVPHRAEQLQVIHRARQEGARVIFVGSKEDETDEWKRQLCSLGVYDFAFFGDEVVLGVLDDFIEHPRTPLDVRTYVDDSVLRTTNEEPVVVEEVKEEKVVLQTTEPETASVRPRWRRPRWGKPSPSTPERLQIVQPRLVVVVGLWPRAGVTAITYLLTKLFAQHLPMRSVACVEHPRPWPRMWDYFQLDERMSAEGYRHWTVDGVGQEIEVDGVDLVPLSPGWTGSTDGSQPMVQYIFRQMRKPVTLVDVGAQVPSDMLLGVADRIVCVLDCDPTFLSIAELGNQYRMLTAQYGESMVTVLNKWTRYAHYDDLFEDAVRVPYLDPNTMQQALWAGRFPDVSAWASELHELTERVVKPLLPTRVGG